jgi:hypothetical protein
MLSKAPCLPDCRLRGLRTGMSGAATITTIITTTTRARGASG